MTTPKNRLRSLVERLAGVIGRNPSAPHLSNPLKSKFQAISIVPDHAVCRLVESIAA